jgi:uncharacterized membrane protein SpoIIM required for sporulation
MKETSFIKQNKQKWYKFEQMYQQNNRDTDELSNLFIELTDDLSYARTHYPKRSVRVYLNGLAQKVYDRLYRKRRDSFKKVIQFWTTSVPLEMYRARKTVLTSFIVMAIGFLIGWVSTVDDPYFLNVISESNRVEYEEECIAENKPISVYQTQDESTMFFELVTNNMRVAFTAFVLGILISIGSGFFMFYNGILLGSFLSFYKIKGFLMVAMMTIWLHGVFEISAIIIAGAAGITLGNSMLFPGSMSRSQSMLLGAKRGMKMMIGLSPFMIGAGFIEAFVSRYGPDMHPSINILIIGVCLAMIIFYFVVYPFIVAKKHNYDPKLEENPIFIQEKTIEWYRLRSFQDIFNDTFVFYRKGLALFGKVFIFIIALSGVTVFFSFSQSQFYDYELEWYEKFAVAFSFSSDFNLGVFIAHILLLGTNFTAVYHSLWVYKRNDHESEDFRYWISFFKFYGRNVIKILPSAALIIGAISFLPWYFLILSIFLVPLVFNWSLPGIMEDKKFFPGVGRGMKIASKSWMSGVGIFCLFLVPAILAAFCPSLIIEIFKTQVLGWFIETQSQSPDFVYNVVDGSYYTMIFHFITPLFMLAFGFLYFGTVEKEEAFGMFKRLESFGEKSRVYETADEGEY